MWGGSEQHPWSADIIALKMTNWSSVIRISNNATRNFE
jgi:hypothetical protein